MKKLLLLLLVSSSSFVSAQVLQSEDFNGLTVGTIPVDFAGTAPGQGDFLFFASNGTAPTTTTNSGVTNALVVDEGAEATLGCMFEGPNGDKGSRYMWKDGFADVWDAREVGNDIIEVELEINPGSDGGSTSRNTFGVYIFNGAGDRILAGFFVRAATRELFLVAYSTPTGQPVGNYNYSLAAAPGIQMPADEFSRIGVSYNKTTGQVRLKGPGIAAAGLTLNGSSPNTDPGEIDLVSFSGHVAATPNTGSGTMVMDNLLVKAALTDTLLGTDKVTEKASFTVSPNPAKNIVYISSTENTSMTGIEVFDINGRMVKSFKVDNLSNTDVNIADLATGVYTMKIASDRGIMTKKVIKQ